MAFAVVVCYMGLHTLELITVTQTVHNINLPSNAKLRGFFKVYDLYLHTNHLPCDVLAEVAVALPSYIGPRLYSLVHGPPNVSQVQLWYRTCVIFTHKAHLLYLSSFTKSSFAVTGSYNDEMRWSVCIPMQIIHFCDAPSNISQSINVCSMMHTRVKQV